MSTIEEIIADVVQTLIYNPSHTGNGPKTQQNTEAFWKLFTPNINPSMNNHDIVTTTAAVKKEFPKHPTLFHLSPWAQDIIVAYITFDLLSL
jgi:hypothetical protein